jgi:hypothetical protein
MIYRSVVIAAVLATLPTTAAFAQVSFRAPGVHVSVPLPDNGYAPRCRMKKVYTDYGWERQSFCLASDGRWYSQAQIYPQTNAARVPDYPSQGYEPRAIASANLSGEWRSQSGGIFDISQSGDQVEWSGHSQDGYTWQNHFTGRISGSYLRGYFEDVAASRLHNSGPLTFRIEGSRLVRVNATRAFADTVLMRSDAYVARNDSNNSRQQQYEPSQQQPVQGAPSTPSTKLDQLVDQFVLIDSKSWGYNRYAMGSARNSKIIDHSGSRYTVSSEFSYLPGGLSGSTGWVKIQFDEETPECLEFKDFEGNCRPIGHSPGAAIAGTVELGAIGILAYGILSNGSSPGGENAQHGSGPTPGDVYNMNNSGCNGGDANACAAAGRQPPG